MNATEMKAKRGKCLALVAVLAMVVCAFAVALPAGESDADIPTTNMSGYTELSATDANIADGGKYFVRSDVIITGNGATSAATIVLVSGSVKMMDIDANADNVTFYLAADGNSTTAPTKYYTGLYYTGVVAKTYYADVDASSNRFLKSDAEATGAGIVFTKTASSDLESYPAKFNVTLTIKENQSVAVKNGSATITTKNGDNTVATITLNGVESSTGIIISCGAEGAMIISGSYTAGSITMVKGEAAENSFTKPTTNADTEGTPLLNAYSESGKITALPAANTAAVYGNVSSGDTAVTSGVIFYNATVKKLTIGASDSVVISADKLTTQAAISSSNVGMGTGSGKLTLVSGNFTVAVAANILPGASSTLNIGPNATVTVTNASAVDVKMPAKSVINVNGTLTTSTTGNNVTFLNADDITDKKDYPAFNAYSGAVFGEFIIVKTGIADIENAMQEFIINKDINSSGTYSQFQIVRVTEDITIADERVIGVLGKLIIDKGASVTIKNKATLVVGATHTAPTVEASTTATVEISGDMEIMEGGLFQVVGGKTVTISGSVDDAGTMEIGAETVLKSGSIVTVEESGKLYATKGLKVSAGAKVTVEGEISAGTAGIENAGEIVINGTIANYDLISQAGTVADVTIKMVGNNAILDLRDVTFTNSAQENRGDFLGKLIVTDDGLKFNTTTSVTDVNRIEIIPHGNALNFTGMKITEIVTSEVVDDEVVYTNAMDISGNIVAVGMDATGFGGDNVPQNWIDIQVTGNKKVQVTETLSIGEGVMFTNNKNLFVSGQLNQVEAKGIIYNNSDGVIDVTGQIKVRSAIDFSAYPHQENTTPGKINAAMYKADESGVTYKFYTTLKLAIDSGAKDITALGTLTVEEDITVPAGVTITGKGTINVATEKNRDATMTVDDGAKLKNGMYVVNGTLYFAVAKTGNRTDSIISDVYTTTGIDAKYTNLYKALNDAQDGETVKVTGNDVRLTQDVTVRTGVTLLVPAGKYLTLADGVTMKVEGTLDAWEKVSADTKFAEKASSVAPKTSTISVTGVFKSNAELNYSDYAIPGAYFTIRSSDAMYNYVTPIAYAASVSKDVQNGKIDIYGNNTAGDVSFEGTATMPVTVTIYQVLSAGTITLKHAKVTTSGNDAVFTGSIGSDVGTVALANAKGFVVSATVDGENDVVKISGNIVKALADKTFSVSISAGTVIVKGTADADNLTVSALKVAQGATLNVYRMANVTTLTVDGEASALNGGRISSTDVIINGTLTIGDADPAKSIAAGILVADKVFVGITKKAVLGAASAFNASAADVNIIYVAAGSTVTADLVKDMKKTVYNVDGSEYLTVYANSGSEPKINDTQFPKLAGKEIESWQYTASGVTKDVEDSKKVGEIATVDAKINVYVYNVLITADYGFADVFIDGAKVASIAGGATIYVDGEVKLAAGTHTIDWKLKNNYAGDITGTFNGKEISDKKFTITTDMDFSKDCKLVLTGAVEQPQVQPSTDNGGDDGMGITDILLIVLVVLIAVMAIMVALRLMRS